MYLHALGHFHPETAIDNHFLEQLDIGTSDDWIVQRTGIRRRHTVLSLEYICSTRNRDPRASDEASRYSNAETGCRALHMALDRARLAPEQIGMLIAGGCAPRMGAPAEACLISELAGIAAPSLDLNSGCSTFAAQLHLLSMMSPEAAPDFIALVQTENLTRVTDYSDRSTAVLLGDCTTAAIVSHRVPAPVRITHTTLQSDPAAWRKVTVPSMGHMRQEGGAVQNFAIRKMSHAIEQIRPHAGADLHFVGHQANLPMLRSVCARAGVDESKHFYNVDRRGNCGAAGAVSVLSERFAEFRPGDHVAVAVVGAGLSWGSLLMQFDKEIAG
jgi:3-oxoacyl-[acyl-carrier-protein] synthase-3